MNYTTSDFNLAAALQSLDYHIIDSDVFNNKVTWTFRENVDDDARKFFVGSLQVNVSSFIAAQRALRAHIRAVIPKDNLHGA